MLYNIIVIIVFFRQVVYFCRKIIIITMEVRFKSHKVTDTKGESVEVYVLSSILCSPSIAHRLAICLGQLSGDKKLYLSVEHDDKVDRFIIYDNYMEEEEEVDVDDEVE